MATFSSTMPPPTAIVSAACDSAVSPSATAAAMPPCAHALDAPSPSGAAAMTVTRRGASLSAQNNPARPAPTMTTSPVELPKSGCENLFMAWTSTHSLRLMRSVLQIDHPFDRTARPVGDHRVDRHFLTHVEQA